MADAAYQDEEVENRVHVALLVEAVEDGTGDIGYSLGYYPRHRGSAHTVEKGLEGYKDRQTHAHKTEGFEIAVLLEMAETDNSACYCTQPYEDEKTPAPIALLAQGHEGERGVRAGYMPIDSGMVPLAQTFLPLAATRGGMIGCGGGIRTEHAEEIEYHSGTRP